MHRSAQTLVESGGAGKDLCHCSVEQEPDSQLFGASLEVFLGNGYGGAVPELVHHLIELLVRENLDGAQSLCENLAVGAVRSEDEVVSVESVGHTHCGGLLAC